MTDHKAAISFLRANAYRESAELLERADSIFRALQDANKTTWEQQRALAKLRAEVQALTPLKMKGAGDDATR
jgi:hypothetical protein